ncbi:MAG: hypothetical protein RMJ87_08575 [Cytophagales bacterium]|nr:hypothetical protein [Cytophagales bacterium]
MKHLLHIGWMAAALLACNLPAAVVTPPPKGITRFQLNISYAEIAERNEKNERWDIGVTEEQMAPDVYYVVTVAGKQVYKSAASDNKYITQWLEKSDVIDMKPGEKITISFYDYDYSIARTGMLNNEDDFIGAIELTIDELINGAKTSKEFTAGQVKKFRISLHSLYR